MALNLKDFASFCKKKGFIYASSELYGGVAGLYDYGHLGTKLKKNFEDAWRKYFLGLDDNFFEIETANIMHENVFKASGHIDKFIDPIVKCSKCIFYERADHFLEKSLGKRFEGFNAEQLTKVIIENKIKCPLCKAELLPVSVVNMMFPLMMGAGNSRAYLRPETAQSPYVNFKLQYELQRKKMPLGLGLVGRAYRNEISPRNLTLRQREFTQAELQIFFDPEKINEHPQFDTIKNYKLRTYLIEDRKEGKIRERFAEDLVKKGIPKFYVYHLVKVQEFFLEVMKVPLDKFRCYQLDDSEKAFYNKYHFDLEIDLNELGYTEVGGVHYRTDHDLSGHQRVSKQNLEILDEENGRKFIPHVLELSFGVDRNVYSLLDLNLKEDSARGNLVLKLPLKMAAFLCAVFPLVKNKEEVLKKAEAVYKELKSCYSCYFDESGSVGRRYARADEIGVAHCITVDFDSLVDDAVTIRDRDNTQQVRVKISELKNKLWELYTNGTN